MNARSQCTIEPGAKSYEGDDPCPDASMPKFPRTSRSPVEITIDLAIDAAVITAIVLIVLLASMPWLLP